MNQTIIPPAEGWKPHTFYKVEASFNPANPIHGYLFYSGFLNGPNETPGSYNEFCGLKGTTISWAYYMRVLEKVTTKSFIEDVPHKDKMPNEIPIPH